MLSEKINLKDKYSKFNKHWSPRIIAEMNNYHFKLAKIKGEFVWHDHKNTDETFIVIEGNMTIKFRDNEVKLSKGEMYVVPKGVEHCPKAQPDTHFMMIEPSSTAHTGEIQSKRTVSAAEQEWI